MTTALGWLAFLTMLTFGVLTWFGVIPSKTRWQRIIIVLSGIWFVLGSVWLYSNLASRAETYFNEHIEICEPTADTWDQCYKHAASRRHEPLFAQAVGSALILWFIVIIPFLIIKDCIVWIYRAGRA